MNAWEHEKAKPYTLKNVAAAVETVLGFAKEGMEVGLVVAPEAFDGAQRLLKGRKGAPNVTVEVAKDG